jgi:hypothetical protein
MSSEQILDEISASHMTVVGILASRSTNLKVLRALWAKGNVRECIETMARMKDPSVVVDILNTIQDKIPTVFNLDMCVEILPVVNDLLSGQHQE